MSNESERNTELPTYSKATDKVSLIVSRGDHHVFSLTACACVCVCVIVRVCVCVYVRWVFLHIMSFDFLDNHNKFVSVNVANVVYNADNTLKATHWQLVDSQLPQKTIDK